MPVIVSTLGAPDANSLLSLEQADAYFDSSMSAEEWSDYDIDLKARALISASASFGTLSLWGNLASPAQSLPFPRVYPGASDGLSVPRNILAACAEHALELARAKENGQSGPSDRERMRRDGVTSYRLGDRSETFSALGGVSARANLGQFSPTVQRLLTGWVRTCFPLDSGRYGQGSASPGWQRDYNGLPWPSELTP